ncbi:MAG: hypothetical protein WC650_05565 [Candidatus Doudnabacteria bacterium]
MRKLSVWVIVFVIMMATNLAIAASKLKPLPLRDVGVLKFDSYDSPQLPESSPTLNLKIIYQNGKSQLISGADSHKCITLIEPNSILARYIELRFIRDIKKISGRLWKVNLKSGQNITGYWVEYSPDIYPENAENPPQITVYGYFKKQPSPERIDLREVKEIIIDSSMVPLNIPPLGVIAQSVCTPMTIVLKNSSRVTTRGFIIDYCGHYWDTIEHHRMAEYVDGNVQDTSIVPNVPLIDKWNEKKPEGCREVSISRIQRITFTGKFGEDLEGCRQINVYYRDGTKETTYLFLTGESYNGICYPNNGKARELDSIAGVTDYDFFVTPLDNVAEIIINAN